MLASLRRSASASAAIFVNSLPRWLISITDMPASCQLTSSHLAFSSTSTGMVAGPAPKLKIREAGWAFGIESGLLAAAAIGIALARAVGKVVGLRVGIGVAGRERAIRVSVAVAVLAVLLVAIEDAL